MKSGRPRITVICAPAPHFNPGMLSVDCALSSFLRRHRIDTEVDRRAIYTPRELHDAGMGGSANDYELPFGYRSLRAPDAQIGASRALIFWGDFLHSRHYRGAVAKNLVRARVANTEADALALVDRHVFLVQEPEEVLSRSILFGNCLLSDDTAMDNAAASDAYERNLRRLVRGGRGVWMRDVISARRAAELRGSCENHLGVDCALLSRPEEFAAIAGAPLREGGTNLRRAGIFFARTPDDPALLLGLARAITKKLGIDAEWLPWFQVGAFSESTVNTHFPGLVAPGPVANLPQALRALFRYDCIITDAYHLCVHAWNLGIPALCIGRGAAAFRSSVSDKKKEIFFLTYEAQGYYVFAEHLAYVLGQADAGTVSKRRAAIDVAPPSLDHLAERLHDRRAITRIQARLHAHREAVEPQLVSTLHDVLGSDVARLPQVIADGARRLTPNAIKRQAGRLLAIANQLAGVETNATAVGSTLSREFRDVVAVIAAYNEADVIAHSLKKLCDQGIGVYLLDNWSTDATLEQALLFRGRGLIGHEKFPPDAPSSSFALKKLLARTEELHLELGARWTIHQDVDEIRESPWPGVSYRDGLRRVELEGYNCVNHVVVNFRPVDDCFVAGGDMERHFRYVELPSRPGHFRQMKAWQTTEPVGLQATGGHSVDFPAKRVFPVPFVLKHYPIRGQAHGERKVLRERQGRFDQAERSVGFHTHYDGFTAGSSFIWDPTSLREWKDATRSEVVEMCTSRMRQVIDAVEEVPSPGT